MLFAVKPEAMNGTDTVLDKLDDLISRVEDDIHELELADADLLEDSGWYKGCRGDRRHLLKKCAEAWLHRTPRTRGPHLRRIEVNDESTAKAACTIAFTSLQVLVENSGSDGALVKFAIKVFATPVAWELCFGTGAQRTPPAIRIDGPGGSGELPKLLRVRLQEAAARGVEPRIVVMTDSDGEWVGDVKTSARKVRDDCASAGVRCPPLNKRSAENYIPDAVWMAWAAQLQHSSAGPAVDALLRLSCHQRDYVNIGAENVDPWDSSKPDAASLFASVSAQDRDLLKAARFKGRRSLAIASMLELQVSTLTHTEFQSRDHEGDLEALVRCIEDEL